MPTQMPKNGRPFLRTRLLERVDHAGDRIEPAPAIGEGADARQHDAVGAAQLSSGSLVTSDRLVVAALARGALERLRRRVQIARAVIDDGDAHAPRSRLREQTDDVGWLTARRGAPAAA